MRSLLVLVAVSLALIAGRVACEPQTPDMSSSRAGPSTTNLLLKDTAGDAYKPAPALDSKGAWDEMMAQQLVEVGAAYDDFFAMRGVEPAKIDRLVRLLAKARLLTSSWANDLGSHTPQATDYSRASEAIAQIEDILGREAYAALTQYQDTLYERFHLRKLVRLLITVGHPLSTGQREQMVAMLVSERYRLPGRFNAAQGSPELADELVAVMDAYDDAVQKLFARVLTPEQRELTAKHYAGRGERRHAALTRYRKGILEGDGAVGFSYPAE